MALKEHYVGDLVGAGLLAAESRVIAETLLKKPTEDEWKKAIIDDDILQKKSVNSAIRNARTLRKRLGNLGDDYLEALLITPEAVYVQLLMVALLIHSPVLSDFMREVLGEAKRIYMPRLSSHAWGEFIDQRIRVMPELANFSDTTLKKMGTNAIKALVDCGYLSSTRERRIQGVYLMPEVKTWIVELDHEELIEVMECTV